MLGYHRLDHPNTVPLLNKLYSKEWRLFHNFFCPSVKLISKKRGSREAHYMKKHLMLNTSGAFFMQWEVEYGICTFATERDNLTLLLPETGHRFYLFLCEINFCQEYRNKSYSFSFLFIPIFTFSSANCFAATRIIIHLPVFLHIYKCPTIWQVISN